MTEKKEHIWFDDYTTSFINSNPSIEAPLVLKQEHCLRVSHEMRKLADSLKLPESEIAICAAAGLLHDVGRFEQYKKYRTFLDIKSVNHAEVGVNVIKASSALDRFNPDVRKQILMAISYHNRATLPDSEECLRLSKMLRDADKIDIWKVVIDYFKKPDAKQKKAIELNLPDTPSYSKKVVESIKSRKLSSIKSLESVNDFKLLLIGWVYDINFPHSFKVIQKRNYIKKLQSFLPPEEEISTICNLATEYVNECCR
ncbi:HD domain-containing protein [Chitinispirillales bacterium ANBcel5]|uniref:HD domain-containing protein n=1 Tax=Cellulosispirillum alkaliphilum TaxID=3039283 RepID=UPI002A590E2A|nr:HD domain-containing protein [Chitinispirillales bacterium ANBcel5]